MTNATKVQIYLGAASLADVQHCIEAGADIIGLVADERIIGDPAVGGHVLPSLEQVADIFAHVQHQVTTVALTFDDDLQRIADMVRKVRPKVVHFAGNRTLSLHHLKRFRSAFSDTKIMMAIPVNRPEPIAFAVSYQSVCDYFLLDSKGEESDHPYGVGATGQAHDWAISAELVRSVNIPVILAGGLSANNVCDAIKLVQPWGVDSFTLTNITPDRESKKDPIKVREFIDNAKQLKFQNFDNTTDRRVSVAL